MSDIDVVVHPDRCMATGVCRDAAPDVFGADSDGWVRLLLPHPPLDRLEAVLEAADYCPLAAIDVTEGN